MCARMTAFLAHTLTAFYPPACLPLLTSAVADDDGSVAGREKKVLTTEKKSTHTYTAVLVVVVAAAVKCSSSLHSLKILQVSKESELRAHWAQ